MAAEVRGQVGENELVNPHIIYILMHDARIVVVPFVLNKCELIRILFTRLPCAIPDTIGL